MDRKHVLVSRIPAMPIEEVCGMAVRLGYDFFTDNPVNGVIFFVAHDQRSGPVYYSTGLSVADLR